ncbi:MAG: phosphoribosylaminoimidazolesuccinocarboxamide synthase [bacterium]|nr:phosphoribosylaminoimidazolesuccinocarboxamide synthase [bacterium]
MEKMKKLYEGKAKIIYATRDKDTVIQYFKDDATAFNGKKKDTIEGKGIYNAAISSKLFLLLEEKGIPTHFIKLLSPREMLVKKIQILPIEVVARNVAAGSLAKRLGVDEGLVLKKPVLEYYYKDDALGDPMVNEFHIDAMGWATKKQLESLKGSALKINNILQKFFLKKKIELVDFKLEFGLYKGKVILGDEISPDTCRFWDLNTREKMDKDRFRRDLGGIVDAYQEVMKRVVGAKC